METKGNKPMPENPQPNDEVQLHIETVTPETEKENTPTEPITSEDSKDQEVNPEDSKDLAANEEVETEEVETEEGETEGEVGTDSEDNDSDSSADHQDIATENPAAVEDNKGGGEPGGADARDQVETVSP